MRMVKKNAGDLYKVRDLCRICGQAPLETIIKFPDIPIADALLEKEQLEQTEIKLPMSFAVCSSCFHAQIQEDVLPEVLFGNNYPYYTGVSAIAVKHYTSSAQSLIDKYKLGQSDKVLEIASNDGTMLEVFQKQGCVTLGVDPADGPCKVASSKGLNVVNTFFGNEVSEDIKKTFGKADLILGNNVLAHVPEPNDMAMGIANLLSADGHVVIEVPHLLSLLEHVEFDTIFHQHYSYFSVSTAQALFQKYNLYLNDVEQVPIHGGSIRLYFSRQAGESESVLKLKSRETEAGLMNLSGYKSFAEKVGHIINDLNDLLAILKKDGKSIVGYGAAGKANTLINVAGIGTNDLEYIADLSQHKQGKYFTGAHLPIVSPDKITNEVPDYVLILAWNFKDEIMQQLSVYKHKGGKFIIPIPAVKIIG